jgi:co-chaperonin GroES (HSP10)
MRTPINKILVKLEKKSENVYTFANGTEIFFYNGEEAYRDGTYNPHNYTRIYGEVAVIPDRLTRDDRFLVYVDSELALYEDSIVPEVQVGDRIYFHYISVQDNNFIQIDKEMYYSIPYSSVLCVVRDKKIIPIGGYVLSEPYYGEGVHVANMPDGTTIRVKKIGSFELPVYDPLPNQAVVKHVGTPLKGFDSELSVGDIILIQDKRTHKNTIEGVEYYTTREIEIEAVLGHEAK